MLPHRQLSNFGSSSSRNTFLEKRVPENPRYNHVKPVVDSAKLHKANEVFRRIRLSNFVRLVIEVSKAILEDEQKVDACDAKVHHRKAEATKPVPSTSLQSVITGIGEVDRINEQKNPPLSFKSKRDFELPYLLLDVRCKEDYDKCHIITATNYPYTMLCRSPGYETNDLRHYRNAVERLILVYDEDESIASRVASTLVQRGYDNVYLLTGGLKLAYEKFAENLITGTVPLSVVDSKHKKDMFASTSDIDVNNYVHRNKFTAQDICKLQELMDLYLNPSDSSRSSSSSSLSRPTTRDRKSQSSTSKLPPWK